MLNILVLSIGSLVGKNILDVLESRRDKLNIIASNSIAESPNLYRCDYAYLVPEVGKDDNYLMSYIIELIEKHNINLVIPCRDEDILFLANLKKQHKTLADKCLCGHVNTAKMMLDKWQSYLFSQEHSLPFVESMIPNPNNKHKEIIKFVQQHGFPLLVKPRRGFASKAVYIIFNQTQLDSVLDEPDVLIQEYLGNADIYEKYQLIERKGLPLFLSLEQDKYSLQAFIKKDGTVSDSFCTVHKMVMGKSLTVTPIHLPELQAILERYSDILASKGWFGPLNIQCQRQVSGEFKVFELNGRFTGATSARFYLGFDEVGIALDNISNTVDYTSKIYKTNQSVFRQLSSEFILQTDRQMLANNKQWKSRK